MPGIKRWGLIAMSLCLPVVMMNALLTGAAAQADEIQGARASAPSIPQIIEPVRPAGTSSPSWFQGSGTTFLPLVIKPALTTWHTQTVDDWGRANSLALDPQGYPHILYEGSPYYLRVMYAHWTGTQWKIEEVTFNYNRTGSIPDLEIDETGTPHAGVLFCSPIGCRANYIVRTGVGWEFSGPGGGAWSKVPIALDSQGQAHFAYNHSTDIFGVGPRSFQYAVVTGTLWQTDTVAMRQYESPSLVLDGADTPHLSYYNPQSDFLEYASWNGSMWVTRTVAAIQPGSGYVYNSLDLDSAGNPHLSYYDPDDGDLMFAWWNGTGWTVQTVDSIGDVGQYNSMKMDQNEHPHICYVDYTRLIVKYARWTGTRWAVVEIDEGSDCSLDLDGANQPHISYTPVYTEGLRYAWGENNLP